MKKTLVISLLLVVFLSTNIVACGPTQEQGEINVTKEGQLTTTSAPPPTPGSIYGEAPELAALVEAGKLPPVEERLPTNPLLVQPHDQVGVYGGTWHMGMLNTKDNSLLVQTIGYEGLVRWDKEWTRVVPNLAQSWEVNENSTEFTFHLREGLRWSDGELFTADDILFWYEIKVVNPIFPERTVPKWLVSGGEPVIVKKLDNYTIVFRFTEPNGLFLANLAHPNGIELTSYPRHYLEQFHINYNPDANTSALAAGYDTWQEWLDELQGPWQNAKRPVLNAWILTNSYIYNSNETVVAERNPYYWKVDTDLKQLPYIDHVVFNVAKDVDTIATWGLNGNIDMQSEHLSREEYRLAFTANKTSGNYGLFTTIPSMANYMLISLNMNHKDLALREIFQNKNFRIGLSYAINRSEIIEKVYLGNGDPMQVCPSPESPFYNETMAKQYTEYNVTLANEYLDQAGYRDRDGEGFRLRPDGKRLSFTIMVADLFGMDWGTGAEYVQSYWDDVGIQVSIEVVDRKVYTTKIRALEYDAVIYGGGGGLDPILTPNMYFPYDLAGSYANAWVYWWDDQANPLAETPPAQVQEQMELYRQILSTADEDEQAMLMTQILEIATENFYVIGISQRGNGYGIVKDNFHNVPSVMPESWTYPNPAPTNPCQYYIDPQE